MFIEKSLAEAFKAYEQGLEVVVIRKLFDGSFVSEGMGDFIPDNTHFMVDVQDQEEQQPGEEAGTPKPVPEKKKSKRQIVGEYVKQGLDALEISKITGFRYQLVWQYVKDLKPAVEVKKFKGWNKNREKCVTCQYRGRGDKNGCDYIEHTGHSRGCSIEDCNKYEEGERLNLKDKVLEDLGYEVGLA